MEGLINCKYTRSKAITTITEKLTRDIQQLEMSERCHFINLMRQLNDEAVNKTGKALYPTFVQSVLETSEPYLKDDLSFMDVHDLVNLLVGFTHPDTTKRLALADLIEQRLTQLALNNPLVFKDLAPALYKLGTN